MHSQSVNSPRPATVACPHSSGPVSAPGQQPPHRTNHTVSGTGAAGATINNGSRLQEAQKQLLLTVCAWCEKTRKHRFVYSKDDIRKSFCSEQCLREWRESYAKVCVSSFKASSLTSASR